MEAVRAGMVLRCEETREMGKQDYNQLAEAYGRNRKLHPDVLATLIDRGRVDASSEVLEIGCGTANYITAIAAETGARCTGIDPSREMLRIARENPASQGHDDATGAAVTFHEGFAEALPLPNGQFDLGYSVDVIHHVVERNAAAREMFRVLKPGGMAMIATESEADIRNRTPQVAYFPDTIKVELGRYPALERIEAELAEAGFELDGTVPVSRPQQVVDIRPFRDKAYSSLHLISDEAFAAGLARMRDDLARGPIAGVRRYTIVAARKPVQT